MRFLIFAAVFFCCGAVRADGLRVVVSTAPLHSVVSSVMKGAGKPDLLLSPAVSAHDYRLKPSDMKKLADADVVFWNGKELEGFLPKALAAAGASDKSVALSSAKGVVLLPSRSVRRGASEGGTDPHFWLMPANMAAAAQAVAETLAAKDPDRSALYFENAERFKRRADALTAEIKEKFKGMKGGNFLFFHDAFLYFEKTAGLPSLGAAEAGASASAGARRLSELREKIRRAGKVCLFAEPQFPDGRAAVLSEGLPVRIAKADPTGVGLTVGEDFYTDLIRNLIQSLYGCLKDIE